MLGEGLPNDVAAHDRTQRIGAHTHVVFAIGMAAVLTVERGHGRDFGAAQTQHIGGQHDATGRNEALLRLDEMQDRHDRRS